MATNRDEEYLRRMRALGYEPSLAGMDDEDIEWELARMDRGRQEAQLAAPQPLRTVYRPVDPGLKARIIRQFGQPYDESAIPKGQEFYLNGWDNGDENDTLVEKNQRVESASLRNGTMGPEEDDPWKKAWKLDWGEEGRPAERLKTMEWRWGRDGAGFPSRGGVWNALGNQLVGANAAAGVQGTNYNMAGGEKGNWLIDPFGMFPQYDGVTPPAGNMTGTGTLDRYRSNEIVQGANSTQDESNQSPGKMKPSEGLAGYLKTYEEFKDKPYQVSPSDPVTIGFGHVVLPGEVFSGGVTEEQALKIFQTDLEKHASLVNDWAVKNNIKLSQQQFDALVSFVFNNGNIGVEGETQVIADTIKRGKATPDEIRKAFGLYINNEDGVQPGLLSRRRDEADMFLNGDYRRKE